MSILIQLEGIVVVLLIIEFYIDMHVILILVFAHKLLPLKALPF